ncbi:LOW QUALITY PROTEIN: uncharacterized protein LOC143285481 [Babylonia areolata]|uniref:LOW QUALITY PROTEIN: uncharacterized protein LOC143285481 n=1 Tax=Babylonia areolata TaxID=304850 RepID=UPI003FD077BA
MSESQFRKVRDKVIANMKVLFQENNGRIGLSEVWPLYTSKYKASLSKKQLGLSYKLSELFDLYSKEFEVEDNVVILRSYKKMDKYGVALPMPLKPLWGTGATPKAASAPRSSSGSRVQSTPQKKSSWSDIASKPAASQASSSTSIVVSSSNTDSDSDSDVKITHSTPAQKGARPKAEKTDTGYLAFDVSSEKQDESFDVTPARQQQQPMVFTNTAINPMGRGRVLEQQMQQMQQTGVQQHQQHLVGMQQMQGQPWRPQQQQHPPMAMRFPVPSHPNQGNGPPHPGVMAAMAVHNSNHPDHPQSHQQQQQQLRAGSIENSAASFSQQPLEGRAHPPPLPPAPVDPIWPPTNPKLGIRPGLPREMKQVTVKPVSFQRHMLTREQVAAIAEECIEMLVEAGSYVSSDRIMQLLLQRFNVRDLRDLQVAGIRFPFHIPCVNEHERLLAKVNASIEAFVLARSLCTLYDLEQSLIEYCTEGQKSFEAMRLGPLQCLPIVYEKFKFPQDEKIPEISTADVLEVLSEYLTKNHKWVEKLNLEDVMAYFVDHYQVNSAYSLGIRIRSLPLAAQVLKKSHRDAANTRKQVINRCMATVQEEVVSAFQRAKADLLHTVQGTEGQEHVELRAHYFRMHAEAVLMELLEKFRLLLSLDTPTNKSERKRHANIEQAVNQFLTVMQSEPLGRALLHLSVCVGRLDLQEAAMELLAPKSADSQGPPGSADAPPEEQQKAKQPPSKAMLMEKMKRYVERCLAQGMLTMSHLDRIEEKLLEEFDFPTFNAMGFGRFLHFLLHDHAPKALLDECGGISLGGASHGTQGRAHMVELLEFIRQCKSASLTQESDLERVLCHQFHVTETRQLGYGNIRHLVEASEKPGKHLAKDFRILYEAAFCGKSSDPVRGKREVGMLGHQTREAALACLQSCPLLEDLERWSHWSTVFEPQYGSLKDFLQKFGGIHTITTDGGQRTITTDIIALETQPGCLLRLVSSTSPGQYEAAVQQGDARAACGHLASLVTANRGVEHTPLALLANHTRSALFMLHTSSDVPGGPGQTGACDPAIQFVLRCLLLLPLRLCLSLANQVFLEPLGQVVGSTRSKTLLMEACRSSSNSQTLSLGPASSSLPQMALAQLGCMLGVQEWTGFLTETFTFPQECVTVLAPQPPAPRDELLGDDDGSVEEEEEESEEESEEEESSASFLSDDDEEEEKKDETTKEKKEETTKEKKEKEEAAEAKLDAAKKEETSEEDSEDSSEEEEEEEDEEMKDSEEKAEGDKVKKVKKPKGVKKVDLKDKKDKSSRDAQAEGEEEEEDSDTEEDEEEEEEEEEKDPYRQVIDQIRRDEFGVGVELNADGQRLMRVQQERLGRSLDRLSRDLYSKDTHFVLELVQNADDNAYPDHLMAALGSSTLTQDCPSVRFVIDRSGVTVLNNESGFQEKDVRALCDVGRSTKGKHKYGYIGQKGIGFKSVFRVTSRPEVHSNGFHLCFDVDSGPMGYILPHWCEDQDPQEGWMTKIVLPLKEEMVSEARSLAARFNDIHPSLLLFLHRLRGIHIDNKVEGSELQMRRVDLGENIVEIHHGQGVRDRWLVVKKQLDASAISLQAKSGVEVESTEIALAFPLKAMHRQAQVAPDKQPVFAFLPLRSYGFRFIVQGDFDVPSSREDVDRDSSWNQWLRNEIHTLFIEAFDTFRAHPEFEGFQSLWCYLQFVPLEDEILDFFKPVATQILKKIRATPCMPAVTSASSGKAGNVQWKLPSQTVMVQDALVHEVISPELLEHHLGLYYVHREVAAMLSSALTRSLGVESITSEHLVQVGRSLVAAWGETVGDEEVVNIAKWLACVYRSMDDFQDNSTLINTLQGMRVIPLSNGRLVALSEVTVFMLTEGSPDTAKAAPGKRDPMSVLRQDLQLVHGRLTATPDNEVNSQVTKLLHKLDMKQLSPQDIIHHHILPVLKSDQWKNKDRAVLVTYLMYIKAQRSRNNSLINMEELKAVARVATNHGIKNPATDNVHFPPAYGVTIDLERLLPGYDWTLVEEKYLGQGASRAEVVSWQEFLSLLGVTTFLIVRPCTVQLQPADIATSPWAPLKEMWPASEGPFTIPDFACEELQELVSNNLRPASHHAQMRTLFSLLDSHWDSSYARYATTQLQSGPSGTVVRDSIPSSFAIALQTLRWVPGVESTVTSAGDVVKVEEKESLLPPSVLYIPDPEIKRLLAHTVYYLGVTASNTSTFSRFLRIKSSVETRVVHDALVSWGQRDPATPNMPATFCSTLAHLKHVYRYLNENLTRKEAQDLFHHNTVIFVPKQEAGGQRVVGRMLGRDEVWWQDSSGLFRKYHPSLSRFHSPLAQRHPVEHLYRDIAETFQSSARLQKEPELADFAELLTIISSAFSLKDEGVLPDVLSIYAKIGHAISQKYDPNTIELNIQTEQAQKVKERLKGQKVLVTKRQNWVSTLDRPMMADDPELERMFEKKDSVHFLMLEPPKTRQQRPMPNIRRNYGFSGGRDGSLVDVDSILAFLALFAVPQLSEEVQKEEITEMFEPCTKGQLYVHCVVPFIQRFLLAHHPDIQYAHDEAGMAQRLKKLLFVKTKKLQVRYSLKSLPEVCEIRDEKCVIMGTQFYFHEKHVESKLEVSTEIARFFSDGNTDCMKDLRHFLMELQPLVEEGKERELRHMLERNGVGPLPDGYQQWEVPKPVIVKPPTPPPPPPPAPIAPSAGAGGQESDAPSLRAWPPPAPGEHRDAAGPKKHVAGEGKPMGPTIWPPPKAPEEVQRRRDLPSNLHMEPRGTSDPASQDSKASSAPARSTSGSGSAPSASSHAQGDGGGGGGVGMAHPGGQWREGVERQASRDGGERGGEGGESGGGGGGGAGGGGGGGVRRQDSVPVSGDSRKRKSDQVDVETSGSKRPASEEVVSGDGTAVPREGAPPEVRAGGGEQGDAQMEEKAVGATATEQQQQQQQQQRPGSITRKCWPPFRPRSDQLQLPVWTQLASETEYEELGRGNALQIPSSVTLSESSNNVDVGRWGEHLVYDYLLQQKKLHSDIYEVIWTNEAEESGKPYDFEVVCTSEDEAYTVYVEVKATRSSKKEVFEISANEVKFASEQGEGYHIYRVFSAGTTDQVQLVRLTNVSQRMNTKEVRLLMVI